MKYFSLRLFAVKKNFFKHAIDIVYWLEPREFLEYSDIMSDNQMETPEISNPDNQSSDQDNQVSDQLTSKSKSKKVLVAIVIILFLSVLIILGYSYLKPTETDPDFLKIQSLTPFHLNKPSALPSGLVQTVKFTINTNKNLDLAGKDDFVYSAYNLPLIEGGKTNAIQVRQVDVSNDFDLEDFASKILKEPYSIETINISKAINQQAFLVSQSSGALEVKNLLFITKDNVLVQVLTPQASKEDLIVIAESLK